MRDQVRRSRRSSNASARRWIRRAVQAAGSALLLLSLLPGTATAQITGTVNLFPAQAAAGKAVTVEPQVDVPAFARLDRAAAFSPTCTVLWDDTPLKTFSCGTDGQKYLSTEITARPDPGPHVIRVTCCTGDPATDPWQGSAGFTTLSRVPRLIGLPYAAEQIKQLLDAAGLRTGLWSGALVGSATVVSQTPKADAVVQPGSLVDLVVQVPLVTVPYLLRLTSEEAAQKIGNDLKLGTVTGTGRVTWQGPVAGSRVPVGTSIDLSLGPAPPRLTTVPDVRGLQLEKARHEVEAAGLLLDTNGATAGIVAGQQPAPGSRVLPSSTVSVTITAPPSLPTASHRAVWNDIAIGLIALGVILLCTTGVLMRRRPQRRAKAKSAPAFEVILDSQPARLEIAHVGSAPSPVRIRMHGPTTMQSEIEEVEK